MRPDDLDEIYKRIVRDFSRGEYAPYRALLSQLQSGAINGYILLRGETESGYAICAEGKSGQSVLLSLFAVFEDRRGEGIGTAFLKKLEERYAEKGGIIVEVEIPELADSEEEGRIREKRIEFYKKAGFSLVGGITYTIWDIPMHLMVLPIKETKEKLDSQIEQSLYDIYLGLMGTRYINKMKIEELP